jgi:acetyl-CoA carboxylase biotin carboxyl carrier protein
LAARPGGVAASTELRFSGEQVTAKGRGSNRRSEGGAAVWSHAHNGASFFSIAAPSVGYGPPRMAKDIKAHITGTVWKIEVKVGDKVDEGTTVVILESMKMEMPVESEDEGTVSKIHVAEAQAVTEGQVLVTLD